MTTFNMFMSIHKGLTNYIRGHGVNCSFDKRILNCLIINN